MSSSLSSKKDTHIVQVVKQTPKTLELDQDLKLGNKRVHQWMDCIDVCERLDADINVFQHISMDATSYFWELGSETGILQKIKFKVRIGIQNGPKPSYGNGFILFGQRELNTRQITLWKQNLKWLSQT